MDAFGPAVEVCSLLVQNQVDKRKIACISAVTDSEYVISCSIQAILKRTPDPDGKRLIVHSKSLKPGKNMENKKQMENHVVGRIWTSKDPRKPSSLMAFDGSLG
ncbi:uncharacterized protein MCYG_03725 [Microsporum canis CBS 113480]|uniref:Uncharacterized protein n=1 Tax=Arthroderma otae (strain ATCC MYA-4605 / CBS 113480) TaxID=554155 RepID=C5FJP5_ARTOC|nr:uncharacterized protein MCYG_03725 [Microsporum canis CBS 113480]EEQ30906.1 predicted protein [Microsporum canis CBS 113480]